jgi:hypothetical protein|nr:MAG TPA: hypothetical protein [Caudoviricetes sp.]
MIALILSILQLLILVGMVYVFDNHIYVYTGGAYKKAHVNNTNIRSRMYSDCRSVCNDSVRCWTWGC